MRTRATMLVTLGIALAGCDRVAPSAVGAGPGPQAPSPPPATALPNFGVVAYLDTCPCPPTGGTVSVTRIDSGTHPTLVLDLPMQPTDGYVVSRTMAPGEYVVTYSPPAGFQLLPGEIATVTTRVTGDLQWLTFDFMPVTTP